MLAKLATIPKKVSSKQSSKLVTSLSNNVVKSTPSTTSINSNNNNVSTPTTQKSNYSTNPKLLRELSESFIDGTSANYVEQMYEQYKKDPSLVHVSWKAYFDNVEKGALPGEGYAVPSTLTTSSVLPVVGTKPSSPPQTASSQPQGATSLQAINDDVLQDHMKLMLLIRAYQVRGHTIAKIDPLEMMQRDRPNELKIESYGFTQADLSKEFFLGGNLLAGVMGGGKRKRTLADIIRVLEQVYCQTIGLEYMHIQDRERSNWIRERFETDEPFVLPKDTKINLLDRLIWSSHFEKYLSTKYTTAKRFGLDGCEVMIPGMKTLIDHAADLGVTDIVIGMAHRGRLNVLANVVRKPLAQIFHEFEHGSVVAESENWGATGDVKYHLGTSYDRPTRTGKKVHLSLMSNPSHLEAVNPVVEGKARARQYYKKDTDFTKVMSIQIHGDASFAGQGVVYETINMSGLPYNTTGGTIHLVINNQIGFTTDPKMARAGMYCTDVVKGNGAPIFHVNADDPEAVTHACMLAIEWRQKFHKDVVIDLVCYRRFGHNEIDQPAFTQPLMYQKIAKQKPVVDKYTDKLLAEGIITKEEVGKLNDLCLNTYNKGFEEGKLYKPNASDWLESKWEGFKSPAQLARIKHTGVNVDTLKKVGKTLCSAPPGFSLHPALKRILAQKQESFETGKGFDWATAEAMAFGTLLLEGNHVRLAGQDVERGTFSQRHAVFTDQTNGSRYTPLNNIPGQKENISLVNSCLSEFAELGFELGYSLESPNSLVLWEAQFGDFNNGAQIIIDQFISSGEQKWFRQSGLVMLLPHGYEGAGPEHSSSRVERFLQMSDQDLDVFPPQNLDWINQIQRTNWQVANCSTPANYFHILRGQIHREFRKPLILITPKSLLRHPLCKSDMGSFDDIGEDTRFQPVIGEISDGLVEPSQIKRVIFCTGKVFYDLFEAREKKKVKNVAIVRIELLAPFPFHQVAAQIRKYPSAEVVWCQEEPKNMGYWSNMYFGLRTTLRKERPGKENNIIYVGRIASASPATASHERHEHEMHKFLNEALVLPN